MLTLVIYGSAHRHSFTRTLLRQYLTEKPGEICYFNCYSNSFAPCDGCQSCKTNGFCRHHDLNSFYRNFEQADRIVFAFPVYNNSFPAPLKAVIDRFQVYYHLHFSGQRVFKTKRPTAVLMTAGSLQDRTETVLAQLTPAFTVTGCTLTYCAVLLGTDTNRPTLVEHPEFCAPVKG